MNSYCHSGYDARCEIINDHDRKKRAHSFAGNKYGENFKTVSNRVRERVPIDR